MIHGVQKISESFAQLYQQAVDASSISAFKGCLDRIGDTRIASLVGFFMVRPHKANYLDL